MFSDIEVRTVDERWEVGIKVKDDGSWEIAIKIGGSWEVGIKVDESQEVGI